MPTEAKQAVVAELREQLAGSRTLIVSEYRGLTVREIGEIRRSLRKQDVSYRVVKNRLMKIAAADNVRSALDELLVGPTAIGLHDTVNCLGIHLNMPIVTPDPATMNDLTPREQSALAGMKHYADLDSGYSKQQSTRPQTLGYGLADSPSGQAAWIVEKFWSWMDCDGHPENVVSRDELLDNVMLYWLPNTAASSARLYWESFNKVSRDPVSIPVGCSMFPKEIFRSSRRWAEQRFPKLVYWNDLDKGGHFAAFEQPATFVNELRACFRHMRPAA